MNWRCPNLPRHICPNQPSWCKPFCNAIIFFTWQKIGSKLNQITPYIYPIICLKSVDVRRLQVGILARSPREMSHTDRILPRYFLSRVRVSVRPRIFYTLKKLQKHSLRPITDRQRHHSQKGATRKAVHTFTPGGATYVTIHTNVTETQLMIVLALQNPTLRESYPRCNGPAKRGNVCESFEKRLIRYRYRPLLVLIMLRYSLVKCYDTRI